MFHVKHGKGEIAMAIRTWDELSASIKNIIGDRNDDETLAFLEDLNDTVNQDKNDGEDWKTKYEENDKSWRNRYRERFFGSPVTEETTVIEQDEETKKEVKSIDELFE